MLDIQRGLQPVGRGIAADALVQTPLGDGHFARLQHDHPRGVHFADRWPKATAMVPLSSYPAGEESHLSLVELQTTRNFRSSASQPGRAPSAGS
ncbi:hypothetical protein [Accumulibacter sp.]|uniref:hypothetical protein n=1 Tax=Accumulibacter sp. TaxID=2053492 RepID=UPI001AC78773|nr:hypothetical protein [Accumulibacter sp.]MBN8456027.1 hypothetical protein [Accumulibacter sp.]